AVVTWYEKLAPPQLPEPVLERATTPLPLRLGRTTYPAAEQAPVPAVANVNLVHLFDERRLDVLTCDLRAGLVLALSPYEAASAGPTWWWPPSAGARRAR